MAIYANEDGTVTSLTDEYQTAGSGLTGVILMTSSSSSTVDMPYVPKIVICTYKGYLSGATSHTSEIVVEKGQSGRTVTLFTKAAGYTTGAWAKYTYNETTKKLSVSIREDTETVPVATDINILFFY